MSDIIPESDCYFWGEYSRELTDALNQGRELHKPVFMVIYDSSHPRRSRLAYSFMWFMEYDTTKELVRDNFIQAFLDANDPGVRDYVPPDEPLENCLLVVVAPTGEILRREGVHANPDVAMHLVRDVLAQWQADALIELTPAGDAHQAPTVESFANLKLSHWRQFLDIDLDLSPALCVLTGPNGCGKTTVLNVLGRHFGWNHAFLAKSMRSSEEKLLYTDAWETEKCKTAGNPIVGSITYLSGTAAQLTAPTQPQGQYDLVYENQRQVIGLHIPSHRPPASYQRISQIPVDPLTAQQRYQAYQSLLFQTYGESQSRNPTYAMKETLIAFAVFGEGNSSVPSNRDYMRIFEGFQGILRDLLPETLGFDSIEVRAPEVIIKTATGDFPLEALSGGLVALFSMAWQIHMYAFDKPSCTVLIDEPENHLHPSMQREFLPRLSRAFPSSRFKFVVATHSPFVVTSKRDAAVYALTYNQERRVVSKRLEGVELTGTPNEVLREILDVPVTMPVWVEKRIGEILARFSSRIVEPSVIREVRDSLEAEGLGEALGTFLVEQKP